MAERHSLLTKLLLSLGHDVRPLLSYLRHRILALEGFEERVEEEGGYGDSERGEIRILYLLRGRVVLSLSPKQGYLMARLEDEGRGEWRRISSEEEGEELVREMARMAAEGEGSWREGNSS